MKKIYFFFKFSVPVALVLVLSASLTLVAQRNVRQILPGESSIVQFSQTGTSDLPVFRQPFTSGRIGLTNIQSVQNAEMPVFKQQFSQESEQLSITQPNLKSAIKMTTSFPPDFGGNNQLAVATMNAYQVMSVMAIESPIGTPDFFAVATDQTLNISAPGFLVNDIDLEGELLTAIYISDNVDNGTLAAYSNGSFNYTPDAGFIGTDQFSYLMQDASDNQSGPVTVTITVMPAANRTPVGTADNYAMLARTILSIGSPGFLMNDIDLDGEALTAVSINDNPDHGTLSAFANGSFTYTPDAGFTGSDQFLYRMRDASNNFSDPVSVTVTVFEGNRKPIGMSDQFTVVMNTVLTVSSPGFLSNDIDLDGEALTAVSIAGVPDHGVVNAYSNGSFNYTPEEGFTGTDQFLYRMRDDFGNLSDPIVVSIFVSMPGTTPVGTPDNYAVPTDQALTIAAPGFLMNDIDLDGEALTAVSINDNPDHGTLSAFADGSFTYTPEEGYTGTDQFSYRMRDASNNFSDPVVVNILVLPAANRTPIGTPDNYAMLAGTTLSVDAPGFLVNDIDLDGEELTAVSINDDADHGTLSAFANGNFTYTPDVGFTGTDQFSYRMRDATNHFSDPVTVIISVLEGNRKPIGVEDHYAALMNTSLSIGPPGFLMNDIDLDGEALTAVSINDDTDHGTLAAFADGNFIYTPDPGFVGTDYFSYRMRDASNNFSDPVFVTIEVYLTNQPPVADAGEDQNIECDGSEMYTVILDGSGSSDPEGDPLIYTWRLNGDIIAGPSTDPTAEVQLSKGSYEIELTVEDTYMETHTDVVIVTIEDTTAPTFTAPGNIIIVKTADCSFDASVSITGDAMDLYDACDSEIEAIYSDVILPGTCVGEEIITRTWTVTDDSGNSNVQVQVITAEDQTGPSLQVPEDQTICMDAMPEFLTGTWTDNCSAGGEVTATGAWYGETDCSTTYAYLFQAMDDCGNMSTETVYVTRETEVFDNCETAYAYMGDESMCFLNDKFKSWGWTNFLEPSETSYSMELYAAAGQCSTEKGYPVGTVDVLYIGSNITVTYSVIQGYVIHEAHIYVGCNKYPVYRNKETVSPGKYTYNTFGLDKVNEVSVTFTDVEGDIFLIAHATVCEIVCECGTTQYGSFTDEMVLGLNCPEQDNVEVASGKGNKVAIAKSNMDLGTELFKVYPNPFGDRLNFEFMTNEDTHASLAIYNVTGQKVETILERLVSKGELVTASFTPRNLVPGVYMYQVILNGNIQTGKVIYHPGITP